MQTLWVWVQPQPLRPENIPFFLSVKSELYIINDTALKGVEVWLFLLTSSRGRTSYRPTVRSSWTVWPPTWTTACRPITARQKGNPLATSTSLRPRKRVTQNFQHRVTQLRRHRRHQLQWRVRNASSCKPHRNHLTSTFRCKTTN